MSAPTLCLLLRYHAAGRSPRMMTACEAAPMSWTMMSRISSYYKSSFKGGRFRCPYGALPFTAPLAVSLPCAVPRCTRYQISALMLKSTLLAVYVQNLTGALTEFSGHREAEQDKLRRHLDLVTKYAVATRDASLLNATK